MKRAALTGIALLAIALTACSASPTPAPATSTAAAADSHVSTSPTTVAATTPAGCTSYTPPPNVQASGGDAIASAIAQAKLPAGVILNPGVQTITSTERPGVLEVVARVCSAELDRSQLIDVGNTIALAAKADPSSEAISLLLVSSWMPGADGMLTKGDTVKTEFQLYTWNPDAAVPLSNNWK